jgi:hypothetical protein
VRLSDFRTRLKKEIESSTVLGERPYQVWINEKASENAEHDSWDACLGQARDCDIFIVLFNGNAGWTGGENGSVGICQAEFNVAYSQAPGKVFVLSILELADHSYSQLLSKVDGGPVHLIACHKGITSAQAQRTLGFLNATVVNTPFGIYVLDRIQAIQLVLIANCSMRRRRSTAFNAFLRGCPRPNNPPRSSAPQKSEKT